VAKAGEVHEPCSSSGCHQDRFVRFNKAKDLPFCVECHVDRPQGKLRYPPYRERGAGDFWLATFDHTVHLHLENAGCASCHSMVKAAVKGPNREMNRLGHEACASAGCHGEKAPPRMTECAGCHVAREGAEVKAARSSEWTRFRVEKTFGHRAHASLAKRNECRECHSNVDVKKGELVPLPPMIACESCHDGKAAFDALGTECLKCHGEGGPNAKAK
jgi:hypothetical protein